MATLKDALQYASQNPTSDFAKQLSVRIKSGQADQEAKSLGIDLTPVKMSQDDFTQSIKKPSFKTDLKGDIKETGQDLFATGKKTLGKIKEAVTPFFQGKQNLKETAYQAGGQLAGGLVQASGDVVKGGVKASLPESAEQSIQGAVQSAGTAVAPTVQGAMENPFVQNLLARYETLSPEAKRNVDATLGFASLATEFVGGGLVKKPLKEVVEKVVDATKTLGRIPKATDRLVTVAKETVTPTVTPEKAIGEVLQGTTKEIKAGQQGLNLIDTTDVKTYKQLGGKIEQKIPELARVVDDELAQDTTKTLLDDLIIRKPTKTGGEVSINYVDNALKQLDELYTKTGDAVAKADIQDLMNIARTEGLTKLEINDIARTYGSEFGEKAFSKFGDPLTTVNAQMFENTRKGVKELARQGLKSDVAIQADKAMSSLYSTKALVQRNIEAVNKLMNRIEERGLFEKIGHHVSKYADLLTGGTLRGVVGGLLPRGAGYKTLNALDLEELLQRNLKIIRDASKAKTKKEFEDITSQLFDDKALKNSLSKNTPTKNQVTSTGANSKNANINSSAIDKSVPNVDRNGNTIPDRVGADKAMSEIRKPFVNTQGGKVAIGSNFDDIIIKDLMSYDTLPVTSNRGIEFGNTKINFRLSELQKIAEKRMLKPAEIKEAEILLDRAGGLSDLAKKRGATALNPLTAGAAVGLGATAIANKKK